MSIWETLTGEEQETKRIYGVVGAVVTNNKDKKGMGRVKVNFPWLSGTHESDWIRIATLMSGNKTGTFFLPEVGDEVLVACENGNIDKPYVIGSLWNGKSKAPVTNSDGKNNIRRINSRSGHQLTFDDTKGKESFEIKTRSGHLIRLDDTSGKGMTRVKTKAGHKIEMDDKSGKEKLTIRSKAGHEIMLDDTSGKEKVEIKDKAGSNKIVIDSAKNAINIESAQKLVLKAKMIEIEGSSRVSMKSDSILTIKGSMVKIN